MSFGQLISDPDMDTAEQHIHRRINLMISLAHTMVSSGDNNEAMSVLRDARRLLGPTGAEIDAVAEKRKLARVAKKPSKQQGTKRI